MIYVKLEEVLDAIQSAQSLSEAHNLCRFLAQIELIKQEPVLQTAPKPKPYKCKTCKNTYIGLKDQCPICT